MVEVQLAREHGSMHHFRIRAVKPTQIPARHFLGCAAIFLSACQSLPAEEVDRARALVAGATLASIGSTASPEVARSQQKLALAQRWMDARDYGPARWLAEQAEVDAELALARAASERARVALAAHERTHATYRVSWQKP